MTRVLYLSTLLCLFAFQLKAQVFFPVTHPLGIKTTPGGVNVKISTYGATHNTGFTNFCYDTYYQDGNTPTNGTDSGTHLFSFWPRVKTLRMDMYGFNIGDTIMVYINGNKYNITSLDIVSGICALTPPVAGNGNLCGPTTSQTLSGRVKITYNSYFDSVRIIEPGHGAGGVGYDFWYADVDSGVNIQEPFIDTAKCAGDTITVSYVSPFKFKSGNSFTFQLSEPNGSFNSYTIMGTINSTDTFGTIQFPIPTSITPGGDYRIRVVSSNPTKTSLPTDATISIGAYAPKPVASSNSPVCQGHTLSLSTPDVSMSGLTYYWTGPGNWAAYQRQATRANMSYADSGRYVIEVASFGCAKKDTIHVSVKPGPGPVIATSNSPVCFADTLKLRSSTALPGTTYNWTGPALSGAPYEDYDLPQAFAPGKFAITATLNGCTSSDTTEVTIKPKPAASAPVNNGPLCLGDTIRLSVVTLPGATYHWKPPYNDSFPNNPAPVIPSAADTMAGKYYLYSYLNGCFSKDSTNLVIKPSPAKPDATSNSPVCTGSRIYLYSTNSTPGVKFSWEGPGSYTSANQNPIISFSGNQHEGNYVVTAELNGCKRFDTTFVKIDPVPFPMAFTNDSVCAGDTIRLTVSDALTGVSFAWSGPENFTSTDQDVLIYPAVVSQSGMYVVVAKYNNCINTDTTYMWVKPMPDTPSVSNNSVLCSGNELRFTAENVTAGANLTWTGPNGFSSKLQSPSIPDVQLKDSGMYHFVVDIKGCSLRDSTRAFIKQTPDVSVTANGPVVVGGNIELKIINYLPGTKYQWTGPNGFSSPAQDPIIYSVVLANAGLYTVIATLDGCQDAASVNIIIADVSDTGIYILYPNPNNGTFTLSAILSQDQKVKMNIYDAAGRFIHSDLADVVNRQLRKTVVMPASSSGVYYLRFRADGKDEKIPFVISTGSQ